MKKSLIAASIIAMAYTAVATASDGANTNRVVAISDVEWGDLNPARGAASPRAADIWGDRQSNVATGFLVKFKDGFSSPPHIHNVTYRGVVISGRVHNDDAGAKEMWMSPGSFWTQPAGEAHITAAKGDHNMAYIEIDSGPYHVHGKDKAFDNGERPVNVEQSNLVWLDASDISWLSKSNSDAQVAFLWGERKAGKLNGTFLKLPAGFDGAIQSKAPLFRAVVIQGTVQYGTSELNPGSYFGSDGKASHHVSSKEEAVIYIRTNNTYNVTQTTDK